MSGTSRPACRVAADWLPPSMMPPNEAASTERARGFGEGGRPTPGPSAPVGRSRAAGGSPPTPAPFAVDGRDAAAEALRARAGAAPLSPLAVDALGAAAMFGVSRAAWLKWRAAGQVPGPRRLGRRVLWDTRELADWWTAGAPSREEWEQRRGGT